MILLNQFRGVYKLGLMGCILMADFEGLISVSQYAKNHGVSVQSVYKRLKKEQTKKELENHIFEQDGIRYLDNYAVEYLETSGRGNSIVISSFNEEIEEARQQIDNLKDELIAEQKKSAFQQEKIIDLTVQLAEAQKLALQGENAVLRLEAEQDKAEQLKTDNEALVEQLAQARADLEAEKNRKLTFGERLRGRRNAKA